MNTDILDRLLLQAIAANDMASVRTLLRLYAHLDSRSAGALMPPLKMAPEGDSPSEALLEWAVDAEVRDGSGCAALHRAASDGDERTVRELIEHGADPRQTDLEGRTAYDLAMLNGHRSVAALLAGEIHAWFIASGGCGILLEPADAEKHRCLEGGAVVVEFEDGRKLNATQLHWNCVLELPAAMLRKKIRRLLPAA